MLFTRMNYIKYQNLSKLHISKSPPLISWILVTGLIISIFLLVTSNFFSSLSKGIAAFICTTIIGCYILYWEDVVLDKQSEKVIITKSNWFQRVLCRIPAKNSIILPIFDIIEVNVSRKSGIRFTCRNWSTVPILENSNGSYKQLKELRHTISSFLRLERVEEYQTCFSWDFTEEIFNHYWYANEETSNDEPEQEELTHFGCRDAIKVITPPERRRRDSSS